ncbi:MAG: hypothetical protein ACRCXB_05295, partial [Aeromonadaceae bacterium]
EPSLGWLITFTNTVGRQMTPAQTATVPEAFVLASPPKPPHIYPELPHKSAGIAQKHLQSDLS